MTDWFDEIKPTRVKDVFFKQNTINKLINWATNLRRRNYNSGLRSCLIVTGGVCTGKTTFVDLILKQMNYDLHYYSEDYSLNDFTNSVLSSKKGNKGLLNFFGNIKNNATKDNDNIIVIDNAEYTLKVNLANLTFLRKFIKLQNQMILDKNTETNVIPIVLICDFHNFSKLARVSKLCNIIKLGEIPKKFIYNVAKKFNETKRLKIQNIRSLLTDNLYENIKFMYLYYLSKRARLLFNHKFDSAEFIRKHENKRNLISMNDIVYSCLNVADTNDYFSIHDYCLGNFKLDGILFENYLRNLAHLDKKEETPIEYLLEVMSSCVDSFSFGDYFAYSSNLIDNDLDQGADFNESVSRIAYDIFAVTSFHASLPCSKIKDKKFKMHRSFTRNYSAMYTHTKFKKDYLYDFYIKKIGKTIDEKPQVSSGTWN